MLKVLPYFNRSFSLRDRLLQQWHVAVQNVVNQNAMRVVELGYQYVLSKSSVEEIDFDDWKLRGIGTGSRLLFGNQNSSVLD
jgi:hypothetical protein